MSFLNHVKQINVSRSFGCVILEDDRIGCWGDQSVLYRATQEIQPPTRSVLTSETKDFFYLPTQPNTNLLSFCKQQNDGQILCSQVRHHLDNNDLLPVEEKKSFVSLSPKEEVEQFQTNGCALTKDHIITCLTETDSKSKTWVRKPELGEFVSISKGFDGDCAIDTAGNVFCSVTEYGNAPYHPFANLKKVQGLSQIIQIDVREKTHCAIDVNQDLYCWNRMEPNKPFSKPIKVLSQVVQVGSTWMSGPDLCAIKVDGSVKCIEVRSSSFDWEKEFEASQWVTRLPSNDPAHILSCGTNHCCVMTKSEKVFCAGNNDDGQLGISGSGGGSFFHEVKLE